MRELGDESAVEHERIGQLIKKHDLKGYTVGEEFGKISANNVLQHFDSVETALEFFQSNKVQDALVLLKGSRGIQLERLVEML